MTQAIITSVLDFQRHMYIEYAMDIYKNANVFFQLEERQYTSISWQVQRVNTNKEN